MALNSSYQNNDHILGIFCDTIAIRVSEAAVHMKHQYFNLFHIFVDNIFVNNK